MVFDRAFDQATRLGRVEPFFCLSLKLRIMNENGEHDAGAAEHVVRRNLRGFLVARQFGIGFEAAARRRSER